MSFNEQQLMQAIYDLIYDSLTQAPPGTGRAAATSETTYLTLAFPGVGLDETQLANPWSPTNPGGLPASAESLAMFTDAVPVLSPVYADSGISLDSIYGQIVSANVAPPAAPPPTPPAAPPAGTPGLRPLMPHGPVALADAGVSRTTQPADLFKAATATLSPRVRSSLALLYTEGAGVDAAGKPIRVVTETPRYRDYLDKRAAYDAIATSYMADVLQHKVSSTAPPPPEVMAAFQTLEGTQPDEVEAALSTTDGSAQSSVVGLFSSARLTYELTRRGSLFQPGLFWHMCQALPGNWLEPSAVFAQVTLSSDTLRLNTASRFLASRVAVGGLLRQRLGEHAPWTPRPLPLDGTRIRISYRFARVEIRRPWLDFSLLSLGGWSMPGRPRNALSTGSLKDNPGLFSLLPTSMIVARDVQISAQWPREAADQIQTALSGAGQVSFGPFALSGASARPGTARLLKPRFDGLTLSMPQLQHIGWLNQVVPACPPLEG